MKTWPWEMMVHGLSKRSMGILQKTPGLVLLLAATLTARAALPSSDITLQPVVTSNLPVYTSLTGYSISEANTNIPNKQLPLLYPYDSTSDDWWDNLVSEQLQARMPVMMCATRGTHSLDPNDLTGPGNMNPRRLTSLTNAFNRAGVSPSLMQVGCMVDSPAMSLIYQHYYGLPNTALLDWSNTDAWNQVVWLRTIKPFFDTVPSTYWYKIGNRPIIEFWGFHPGWSTNHSGNISAMLTWLANAFQAAYGVRPYFVMPEDVVTANNQDATVANQPDVLGFNGWFITPSVSWDMVTFNGKVFGAAIPGYIDPGFFDPSSPKFNDSTRMVRRNNVNGTGANGDTLKDGLENAVSSNAIYTLLEGWTNVGESAGYYRSLDSRWDFPNQYINLIRQYSDLRTVTLKLEAEAADFYNDTTSGNAGGKFRRSGNLDVRDISGGNGWQVTSTAAGEWLQFNKVYFSPGNYKFPIRYSAAAAGKRVRLYVDDMSLGDVTLPATGSADIFDTISLGQKTMGWGTHTLKVQFLDGGVDLDWIFVRKTDPMIALKSVANNLFVCAEQGGNSTIVANRSSAGVWEKFSADDTNGGPLNAGDPINLQSYNGLLVSAEGGGGGVLSVNRRRAGGFEQFTVVKTNGASGTLVNGDAVAFRSQNGKYLTVGAGNVLNVSGTAIGAAQSFTLTLSSQ